MAHWTLPKKPRQRSSRALDWVLSMAFRSRSRIGIDTAGVLTQRGSPIFKGRVPDTDATVVARLKAAGAILIAKTNPPEFSYSIETDNFLTGQTNNPWNLDYTPGGSSGGESAAIAAGMSPLGVGSDLSISLRGPAAHTGIVGFKATHGRMPMTGHWPRVPRRFWHIGPMARSVRDVALAYSLMAGPDGADGFSISSLDLDTGVGTASNRPLRVGWLASPGFFGPTDPEVVATVKAAAHALSDAGCHVEEVRLPVLEQTDASSCPLAAPTDGEPARVREGHRRPRGPDLQACQIDP